KSDVHRSRVRKTADRATDIHDRVNYAAEQSFLRVDSSARTITLELTIDTEISHVMEYFEIFLGRMMMCRRAAARLDCELKLAINLIQVQLPGAGKPGTVEQRGKVYCVLSSTGKNVGCFKNRAAAAAKAQAESLSTILSEIGQTARLEERQVLKIIPPTDPAY